MNQSTMQKAINMFGSPVKDLTKSDEVDLCVRDVRISWVDSQSRIIFAWRASRDIYSMNEQHADAYERTPAL
jgi:hypothetical protein